MLTQVSVHAESCIENESAAATEEQREKREISLAGIS
jgi:hypothetical protein